MHGWERFSTAVKGKHVLVFGLGVLGGGEHVARACAQAGALVRVTDQKTAQELAKTLTALEGLDISYTLGEHKEEDVTWAEIVIKNPSVPSSHPLIQKAVASGKRVTTEAALYLQHTVARVVGVTGTRGKTTTTMMIYEILKRSYPSVTVGGNIQGKAALQLLKEETEETRTVLELSSWQLEGFHWAKISPPVAVITNVYEDHLNRYASMEAYAKDKAAICMYQKPGEVVFLNKDDGWTPYFEKLAAAEKAYFSSETLPLDWKLRIPGKHNRVNAGSAHAVAKRMGCSEEKIKEALESFGGVPSRLETVRVVNGITFINDTTSTTPAALHAALTTVREQEKGRVLLIAGGAAKGLGDESMVHDINTLADAVFFLDGTGTQEIVGRVNRERQRGVFSSMDDAFEAAVKTAKEGDSIVLSPGYASFGMFTNEFDRGAQFTRLVHTL